MGLGAVMGNSPELERCELCGGVAGDHDDGCSVPRCPQCDRVLERTRYALEEVDFCSARCALAWRRP